MPLQRSHPPRRRSERRSGLRCTGSAGCGSRRQGTAVPVGTPAAVPAAGESERPAREQAGCTDSRQPHYTRVCYLYFSRKTIGGFIPRKFCCEYFRIICTIRTQVFHSLMHAAVASAPDRPGASAHAGPIADENENHLSYLFRFGRSRVPGLAFCFMHRRAATANVDRRQGG